MDELIGPVYCLEIAKEPSTAEPTEMHMPVWGQFCNPAAALSNGGIRGQLRMISGDNSSESNY